MSGFGTTPFSKQKSKPWGWIVPSVLLHIAILCIWLTLPGPEPREPGARQLTIKAEQAEKLQQHVADANLKALRAKISELQSIKAAMARIRDEKMARVIEFEQNMQEEAPQDVAVLLDELANVYQSVYTTYEAIQSAVNLYTKQLPPIREAADADTVAGIRALPQLEPFYSSFDGVSDRFEVAFYETGAILQAINVKLEWIPGGNLPERIEALKSDMETTLSMHRDAYGSIPYSWKREASFRELTENLEERIGEVQAFRQAEREGKAEVAGKRAELSEKIAQTEAALAATNAALESAENDLAAIDRNQDNAVWQAKRNSLRTHQSAHRALSKELRDLNKALTRTTYRPDHQLARRADRIENWLDHALPAAPDSSLIDQAMSQQQVIIEQIRALAKSVEALQ